LPNRYVLYGEPGAGKSTLASGSPSPIWLDADDGSARLDVSRYPFRDGEGGHVPRTYTEILAAIDDLIGSPHDFKTLVIDTVDRVEKLIWQHMVARDSARTGKGERIESIESYGYGKGFNIALEQWIELCSKLDRLRNVRGMSIVLIAHATVKSFKNPVGEDYDRYQPALNDKASGFLKGWADVTGFVCHDDNGAKELGAGKYARAKGFSTGRHLLKLAHNAAFDAKNRLSLPDEVEIDIADPWAPFAQAVEDAYENEIPKILASIAAECERIGDEETTVKATTAAKVAAEKQDVTTLARFLSGLKARQPKPVDAE